MIDNSCETLTWTSAFWDPEPVCRLQVSYPVFQPWSGPVPQKEKVRWFECYISLCFTYILRKYVLQQFGLPPGPPKLSHHPFFLRSISPEEPCSAQLDLIWFRFEIFLWLGEHLSSSACHLCLFFFEFFLSFLQGYEHGKISVSQCLVVVWPVLMNFKGSA